MNELAINFWHHLNEWDQYIFQLINSKGSNSFFDSLMPFLRNPPVWAPLYLFLFVFALSNFRIKGLWWIIFFLSTVALTDMTGNYVFKQNFERLRPCSDPDFYLHVRLMVPHCSGGYSFISNHAANHFGMAVFFFLTLKKIIGNWVWIGIAWAASIAYAQVYVGVHYPLDVLAGSLVGLSIGSLTAALFNKRFRFVIFDNQPTL